MPGGFGTLDEFFEILTLIQTEKMKKNLPIVLFGKEYWSKLINFETLVEFGTIDRKALDLFFLTSSVDEAYEYVISSLNSK
jgi:predicted Rossmann-fold nucleotide-binding protein